MAFWNRKKHSEFQYDENSAQDRRVDHDRVGTDGKRPRFFAHGLSLVFVGALSLAAVGAISGQTMIEKTLTSLAMPVGVVWLALMVMVYFCLLLKQSWPAIVGTICWLVLTIAGNVFVSNFLTATLEQPYQQVNVFEMEPLDAVVVLGGGTNSRFSGESQLGTSGDRVATAARLYHAGKVKQIVCTGSQSFRTSELDLDPRAEAAQILIGLGVSPEDVTQMQGHNTSEELRNLRALIEQGSISGRVGLVTSAWHLPRAMRLANSNGLELIPVPSDFLTTPLAPSPNYVVPGADNLAITGRAIKEYLAGWVGR